VVRELEIDREQSARALADFAPFAGTERVLSALVRAGADRPTAHARLREHCLAALESMRGGGANTLADRLSSDTSLLRYLQPGRIRELLRAETFLGYAPQRAREMAAEIHERMRASARETGR
jgi:adenylosuccinate lyase